MYQTPFKIEAEAIQLISDIASVQAVYGDRGYCAESHESVLKKIFSGLEYRHGYGATRLPFLVQDLVQWVEKSKDHILIKACVVLYELETLKPFGDDCRAVAVKCLKDLLCTWNSVFSSIPMEDLISKDAARYNRILAVANDSGDSGIFVAYMLGVILDGLRKIKSTKVKVKSCDLLNDLIKLIKNDSKATYVELAEKLSVSPATVKRRIAELKDAGMLRRAGSKKAGVWQIL